MRRFHKIVEEIKRLSKEQTELKPQRKTVYFTGNRTVDAYTASCVTVSNSERLMHLFIAYAILRGKEPQMPTKKTYHAKLVESFVETFQATELI
ncbi:MAG TPA: hypothetical protein VF680_16725 [Allosphingosinicella sp.]|jgi:hypothetical protein